MVEIFQNIRSRSGAREGGKRSKKIKHEVTRETEMSGGAKVDVKRMEFDEMN
jgi:hypothetical protein